MKKRSKKRKGSVDARKLEETLTPLSRLRHAIQNAHKQTGLKNFPEAVRFYNIAIQLLPEVAEQQLQETANESITDTSTNNTFNLSESLQISSENGGEKKKEQLEELNSPAPYFLYACRSQAYFGMQCFELSLRDADKAIQYNPKHHLGYARKGAALHSLKRYKEALKCYEDGLKFADPNHAGFQRLREIISQELENSTITSSSASLSHLVTSVESRDKEMQERQMEENFSADIQAEKRAEEWEVVLCTGQDLLRPRHAYASALFASQHAWYIYGGYADKGEYMSDFYCFYFPSRTWYKLSTEGEIPKARHSATIVAVEKKNMLLMFGGTSDAGYLEELHAFDLQSRTWRQIKKSKDSDPWPVKRWSHSAAYCPTRNKMYIFGGVSDALSMLNDLWCFDLETETWKHLEPKTDVIPAPRHVHTLSLWNGNLYVYGGFGGRMNFHDLYKYDTENQHWTLVSDALTARRGHATVVYNNWLYVFGGRGKNGNSSSTFKCSIIDGTIVEIDTLTAPSARHYISAAVWGGSMWVFGGIGRTNYNDMFRFWLSSPSKTSKQSPSSIGQDLVILVNNPQFCDVSFQMYGGERAYAHRAILYARCEHFRGMFDSGMKESQPFNEQPIDLTHVHYAPFVALLTWIYTGRIDEDLEGDVVLQLFVLSDQFLLPELRRVCAHVIRRFIDSENVADLLELAEKHNSQQLQLFCQQFIETM